MFTTMVTLMILGEVLLTAFAVWGFMHEQRFIEFEDKIIAIIKHKIRVSAKRRAAEKRRRLNEKVCYSPEIPSKKAGSSTKAA